MLIHADEEVLCCYAAAFHVQGFEGKVLELRTELRSALTAAGRQVQQPE